MTVEKVVIGKLAVEVRELTMQQIADLTGEVEEDATTSIVRLLEETTNAKTTDLMPMRPSELQQVIDKMVEVNTPFLSQQRTVGNTAAADALENLLRSVCMIAFLPSSKQGTE